MRVFTIGHSNDSTEELLARLRANDIAVVVDVRSVPFSRYNPHFNRYVLQKDLEEARFHYVWMGSHLGGVPEDPALYTNGKPDYGKIRSSVGYQQGLQELLRGLEANADLGGSALLCGEQDPSGCHRRRLVGHDLVEQGLELFHIMKDGTVVSEHDVREGLGENQPSVLDLLG